MISGAANAATSGLTEGLKYLTQATAAAERGRRAGAQGLRN